MSFSIPFPAPVTVGYGSGSLTPLLDSAVLFILLCIFVSHLLHFSTGYESTDEGGERELTDGDVFVGLQWRPLNPPEEADAFSRLTAVVPTINKEN